MAPVTHISDPEAFQVQFNTKGNLFAVVSRAVDIYRLQIWDTATNKMIAKFSDKQIPVFSCFSWGTISGGASVVAAAPSKSESSRKRKKNVLDIDVVAIGTPSGSIHLFSPSHGQVIHMFTGGHSKSITDIVFSKSKTGSPSNIMFTCSSEGTVSEWNIEKKKLVETWRAENGSVDKLCLNAEGTFMATAGESIKVWNLESRQQVKALIGYSSSISHLMSTDSQDEFISSSKNDRYINVWKSNGKNFVLTSPANISSIAFNSTFESVSCVTEDGQICLWFDKPFKTSHITESASSEKKKKKRVKSKAPDGILCFKTENDNAVIGVLAAHFPQKDSLMIARGSCLKPVFEKVAVNLAEFKAAEKRTIELSRKPTGLINDSANGVSVEETEANGNSFENTNSRVIKNNDKKAMIIGQVDAPIAKSTHASQIDLDIIPEIANGTVASDEENDADNQGNMKKKELSIGEKLEALKILEDSHQEAKNPKNSFQNHEHGGDVKIPKTDSLLPMLIQALHSSDSELLEQCLRVQRPRMINKTLVQLPTDYVIPFLEQIIDRFNDKAGRGPTLTRWLKSLLTTHMAYLISNPHAVERLTPIYQTIDSRLQSFQSLLKLHGRLEIVSEQIRMRNIRNNLQVVGDSKSSDLALLEAPMMIYDERVRQEDGTASGAVSDMELTEMDEF